MRIAVTAAVLLAVVATALVAVCQHSQTRHMEYRVWQLERRRQRLERTRRRLTTAIEATRTPRRLLCERDGRPAESRGATASAPAPSETPRAFRSTRRAAPVVEAAAPAGFNPGDNFEGVER